MEKEDIMRSGASVPIAYAAKIAGGIGAGAVLVGKGEGVISKVGDGLEGVPGIVNYVPNMLTDVDRVVRISEGIHKAAQSKGQFERAQELLEAAYSASMKTAVNVETSARRAAHYAGQATEEVASAGRKFLGNLAGSVEGIVRGARQGDLEGTINSGYRTIGDSLLGAVEVQRGSLGKAVTAGQEGLDSGILGGSRVYKQLEQSAQRGYEGLKQVQKGLSDVADVFAEIDYQGILQAVANLGENVVNQPMATATAAVTMLAVGEVSSRGVRLWGRRGQGSVLDELERQYGKKVFGKEAGDVLEKEKFDAKNVAKSVAATVSESMMKGLGCVGAVGAAISSGQGYVGKVVDAIKAPAELFSYRKEVTNDLENLAKAGTELAKLPNKFEVLKGKLSLFKLQESYETLKEVMGQIGQSIDYASTVHGNKIWEGVSTFSDNVVEQPVETAVAALTSLGIGYGLARASKFAWTKGEGTLLDKVERRLGKRWWPKFWEKKLAAENGSE